ncbi:MAG: MFS transporter [Lysobacterales bacterium]
MTVQKRWWVLLGLVGVYATTNGIVVHTLPLIYPLLGDEFGWTTAQLTLPATVFFVFGAVTSPPAGVALDRFSPHRILTLGLVGLFASLLTFSVAQTLWQVVTVYLMFGLFLSLCGLTASMVVLTRWFDDQRGRATGLLLMASSLGGALFPQILSRGIEAGGWRQALLWVAVAGTAFCMPAVGWLIRDKTSGAGKLPIIDDPQSAQSGPGVTLSNALRSPMFYLIVIATAALWFSIVALLQHQALYLGRDLGVERSRLPDMFSVFFLCSIVGKLGFGGLSDYLNKSIVMLLSIATLLAGLLVLRFIQADDVSLLYIYAAITGIGFSGAFTMVQLLVAEHFAGPSYGKILAIVVMLDSLAGGAGTRIVALLRDQSGNYQSAFNLMTAVVMVAVICIAAMMLANPSKSRMNTP